MKVTKSSVLSGAAIAVLVGLFVWALIATERHHSSPSHMGYAVQQMNDSMNDAAMPMAGMDMSGMGMADMTRHMGGMDIADMNRHMKDMDMGDMTSHMKEMGMEPSAKTSKDSDDMPAMHGHD